MGLDEDIPDVQPITMSSPKRHHYIPQMHLRHFVGNEPKGQIWTYDGQTGEVRSSTTENTALEAHYYSAQADDGSYDTRIETLFAEIEGKASSTYEKLLNHDWSFSGQEQADFAVFLACMYVRTPAMRRFSAELHAVTQQARMYDLASNPKSFEKLMDDFEANRGESQTLEFREQIRQGMLDPSQFIVSVSKEHTLEMMGAADDITPILYDMHWAVVEPEHGSFITCDNPLVLSFNPETVHPVFGDGRFTNPSLRIIFPLNPKRLLVLAKKPHPSRKGFFSRELVDRINLRIAKNGERYLYAARKDKRIQKLAENLKNRRSRLKTSHNNVKWGDVKVPRKWI